MGTGTSRLTQAAAPAPETRRRLTNGCRKRFTIASFLCGGASAATFPSSASFVEDQLPERTVATESLHTATRAKDLQISSERHLKASSGHASSSSVNGHLRPPAGASGLERPSINEPGPGRSCSVEVGQSQTNSDEIKVRSSISEGRGASLIRSVGSIPQIDSGELAPNGTSPTSALSSERMDAHLISRSRFSVSSLTRLPLNGESIEDAIRSGVEDPTLQTSQEQNSGILNGIMPSTSSNDASRHSAETISNGVRRNSRRFLWDAFARRSSRRHQDSDADDLGFYSRWLDPTDDLFVDEFEESRYIRRRRPGSSRIRGRRVAFDGSHAETVFCPLGIHAVGRCTCDAFLGAEESSAQASISRIVMLTEALFEVLDEIHRQPASLSLSMASAQAPEGVVNSLPSRSHNKLDTARDGDEVEQCYICLTEYEIGDQIRVLPCKHEFHMQCVDKWLKDIHRVCPLCRGDVCEGAS